MKIANVILGLGCLLSMRPCLGDTTQDLTKIQHIVDPTTCFDTFANILSNNLSSHNFSPQDKPKQVAEATLADINFWKSYVQNLKCISKQQFQRDLEVIAWDLYPKFVKAYSLCQNPNRKINEQFVNEGWVQGMIPSELFKPFLDIMRSADPVAFTENDADPNYSRSTLGAEQVEVLNKTLKYYVLNEQLLSALQPALESLKTPIEECLGSPWRIVNIRMWETFTQKTDIGPSGWHLDGYPFRVQKFLIYPIGADAKRGTTELELAGGNRIADGGPGTYLLFRNSEIMHRAVPPKAASRFVIEVTIVPSIESDLSLVCAGNNARYPFFPWEYGTFAPQWKNLSETRTNIE